jgi:hypothetical protein
MLNFIFALLYVLVVLHCILTFIILYKCSYSSPLEFVSIYLKFGVQENTQYYEIYSPEIEYGKTDVPQTPVFLPLSAVMALGGLCHF